jgi:hypothetical protein
MYQVCGTVATRPRVQGDEKQGLETIVPKGSLAAAQDFGELRIMSNRSSLLLVVGLPSLLRKKIFSWS